MKAVTTSEFKTKCLQLINEVAETGVPLVITKNGQPIAQLGPVAARPTTLIGNHKGKMTIVRDILAPIDEEWEAGR
jgi:prevent-host-death family protein